MLSGAADQRTDGHKQIARKVVSGLMGAPAWNGGMPEEGWWCKVKHVGDITKIHGYDLPVVDVITGGSPC